MIEKGLGGYGPARSRQGIDDAPCTMGPRHHISLIACVGHFDLYPMADTEIERSRSQVVEIFRIIMVLHIIRFLSDGGVFEV